MKSTKNILLSLVTATCLCGCQKEVMIRVANRSNVPFHEVTVQFPSQTENYGNILPGETTEYREIGEAYRYAYVKAWISGEEAVLQPTDYVGEKLLSGGNYTYVLEYNNEATEKWDRMRFKLEKD
ncbi:MAG: hypothetical protein WD708_10870 [Kiritimatiellia bacterium]